MPNLNFECLVYGIIILATAESLYCLTQFFGFFSSLSQNFSVTGSWVNPNIIAQFLAMTIPFFLHALQFQFKKIILGSLSIVFIALLLLKCRSAYIGTVVAILVYYGLKYDFKSWFTNPKNKKGVKALIVLLLIVVIPIASHFYSSKKASADGRLFIWKLSAMMVIDKPITGYGYGFFEKEYNLFQAEYIGKGKTTLDEQTNAEPVLLPYNELLQNAVDGGIIGLLLFGLFFGSLFYSKKQKTISKLNSGVNSENVSNENDFFPLTYAGLVCFLAMSMFNFALQVAPLMALLILYAAILTNQLSPIYITKPNSFLSSRWLKLLTKALICFCSGYLLYLVANIAYADSLNKKASILKSNGQIKEALQIMPKIENWQKEESNYWFNYANSHFLNQNYLATLKCIDRAKKYSSAPKLYLGSGICYEQQKQYSQAVSEYTQLVLLHPAKFKYRFRLMTAYFKNNDTTNALVVAKGILNLKPKIPSKMVTKYKKGAYKLSLTLDKDFRTKEKLKKEFLQSKNQRQFHF